MSKKEDQNTAPSLPLSHRETGTGVDTLVLADASMTKFLPPDRFATAGCTTRYATTMGMAQTLLQDALPELIVMPLCLGSVRTIELLKTCQTFSPPPHVVVIARNDQINDAAEAMRLGAFDCLFQPFSPTRLDQILRDAVKSRTQRPGAETAAGLPPGMPPPSNQGGRPHNPAPVSDKPNQHAHTRPSATNHVHPALIGEHPQMVKILDSLEGFARSSAPVLLQGEVGTGKERYARSIHKASGRAAKRFVVLDCATLRPDTVASEVFGHKAGAFPGAMHDKMGAAVAADGGTLFLDEIAHLDLTVQSQLIRFLRSGKVHPLGAEHPQSVDLRIISATSHDPEQLMQSNHLLKELFYQIHVAHICLPPLRDRREDIPMLADRFLKDFASSEARGFKSFTTEAMRLLCGYDWPGNVHELKNVIWNAVLQHDGRKLSAEMLPQALCTHQPQTGSKPKMASTDSLIGRTLYEIEQIVIEDTIRAHGGSVPKAARALGVSPSTIYRKRFNWGDRTEEQP